MLMATRNGSFVVKILDQQYSSWQGTITWLSNNETKPFRSTMELLLMISDALKEGDEDMKAFKPP